jgi:hypothetical protein
MTWGHNQLAEDLANVKGTNFLDVPLGSVFLENPQRADVLEVKKSYTRFCVSIYEVKISRADFQSDIRSGKWQGYLDHCHRFYFAVPSGMVTKDEIPPEAGLIVRGETGWSTIKAARPREVEILYTALLSLLFSKQRFNHANLHRTRLLNLIHWNKDKELLKTLGQQIGNALRNEQEYQNLKRRYEYELKHIYELINEGLGENHFEPEVRLEQLVHLVKQKALLVQGGDRP